MNWARARLGREKIQARFDMESDVEGVERVIKVRIWVLDE